MYILVYLYMYVCTVLYLYIFEHTNTTTINTGGQLQIVSYLRSLNLRLHTYIKLPTYLSHADDPFLLSFLLCTSTTMVLLSIECTKTGFQISNLQNGGKSSLDSTPPSEVASPIESCFFSFFRGGIKNLPTYVSECREITDTISSLCSIMLIRFMNFFLSDLSPLIVSPAMSLAPINKQSCCSTSY